MGRGNRAGGRRARRGALAAALCLLLLLGGCEARPGTNAAPAEGASSASRQEKEKKPGRKKADETGEAGESEEKSGPESASSAPAVDPQAEAQRLLEDRIGELCFYYTGGFGVSDALNPAQVYWSVFKWYSLAPDYRAPDKADYAGYEQLDAKTVRRLAERWYGPDIPEYEGNLQALGDPATGELVNVSENGDTYYFLEVELPMEETHTLQDARVDENGTLTVRITAEDGSGGYLRTYLCKLRPDGKGGYYLISLNKGQV